ncbi:hypothetical protein POTOM_053235 [Populus tomentosa]|uniref:rRNA N-glycosylase n=1 Tax=Populus tomentosa TaxID=118781 RepID=A0A8X7Y1J7_POPTO|nr:hypothetical protein POTOM_053235 [Populus tomentosa]
MPVEFEMEINVQTSTREGYQHFIEKLRDRLGVRFFHNRPALAVQEEPPTRFFDLVIRTNDLSVRFRLRMDNLYLIGYQMENGQWLEFNNETSAHLIGEQGTEFLGFNGSYNSLLNVAGLTMEEVRVGFYNLVHGINQLATSTDRRIRARYLIGVITTLVRAWGAFSAALLRADAYPDESFQLRENVVRLPPDNSKITNISEAAAILGILLGLCFRNSGPRRFPRMTFDDGQCFLGLPLVEVFSVSIDNIDGEDPGQLYGTITVDDRLNIEYIYNRTSSDPGFAAG